VIISLVGIVCFLGYGIYVSRMVIEIRRVEEERERLISDLTRAKEALYHQATHDGLSGLWNRATILERLGQELNRSRRNGALISVVIADVDYFKRVNDAYGHLAGDEVLRQISDLIAHSIRSHDLAGRYGGEEFIMVLPGCDKENARLVCERLREELNNNPIKTPEGVFRITMSFGVATGSATELDLDALVRAADRALYRAKKRGRNRVELGIEEDFLHGEV
jgi:diguanylate cyclase (GGDEF)-like protein